MRISVVIPALNEGQTIGSVLAAIPRQAELEILVVDGGSVDGTKEVAQASGARVIAEPRRGYGRACAAGVAAALGEVLVFMDADGADDPRYLPELLSPLFNGRAQMVLGSRLGGSIDPGAMPWHQRLGNWCSAQLMRHLYGLSLTDLSPFRAVLREKLQELDMQEMAYGWPTEMIAKAAQHGWRILEIPVTYRRRSGGRSKISGTFQGTMLAAYDILRTIVRYSRL